MDEKHQFLSLHASYLPIQVLKTSLPDVPLVEALCGNFALALCDKFVLALELEHWHIFAQELVDNFV